MKIGIDASSLIQKKTGIGSFASSFFESLKEQARGRHDLFFYQPKAGSDLNTPQRMLWEAFELPKKARKSGVDIVYSPGFSPPPSGRFKKVVTVHDVIGLIYPKNVGRVSRWYWSQWLPRNIRRADVRVASSESTRADLEKYLGIPPSSVEVVPLAADPIYRKLALGADEKVLQKYGIVGPFLISVGTLEPRKNGFRLVQAFSRLTLKNPDLSLVLVGKDGGLEKDIRRFVSEEGLADKVKILGYLPDEELVNLYNAALGYAMISLYEGFGLPALEAMSCGLTGVVSSVSSLPEVVGETAWKVNPENLQEIAEALSELASAGQKRRELAEKAFLRAKEFSYEKTAKKMIQIFEKTLA